jgi:pyruvate formate lyase activating enzyme
MSKLSSKAEAYLYETRPGGKARCLTCQRGCVLSPGERGWCATRVNEEGTIYSDIYGEVSSQSVNPIEKKPVYHFLPGSRWLSVGSLGCNFRCPGCQNWDIAHWTGGRRDTRYVAPEDLVGMARSTGSVGISWTFNEPTLWFEYTLDAARLARARGLYTNYVTNGYLSLRAFDLLAPVLDVYRVDIKGFSDRTYRAIGHVDGFEGILEVTQRARDAGVHIEVVTNIIPGYSDDPGELYDLALWIATYLGPHTPWHVTRFHPHHQLSHVPPTPVRVLEATRSLGQEAGLHYVYLGNVPGHRWEHTYCHNCGRLVIERYAFDIVCNTLMDGHCPGCGIPIPGRFA